jgi:hypothetical protein
MMTACLGCGSGNPVTATYESPDEEDSEEKIKEECK